MSNLVLATAKQLAPGALLFEEGFESPVVVGWVEGSKPTGWLLGSNGFGAGRIGLNNEDSTDWTSPGPTDEQGMDPNYTNSGAITEEGVIGPININTVKYRFTVTVAYDKALSGKPYGAASGNYEVHLCAFEPGFLATGGGSRSDFIGPGNVQRARSFIELSGSVANDDEVHTFIGEYTTDPVNDIGRKGHDLAVAIIGATSSAIITSVKVEQINGARRVNWSPDQISTVAWFDAADQTTITQVGGAVSQWNDKSGNANHLIQGTPANQPANGALINGLNALDFTGDFMAMGSNPFGASVSNAMVFAVHKVDAIQQGTLFSLTGTQAVGNRWQAHAPYTGGILYFDCGGASVPNRINGSMGVIAGDVVLSGFYCSVTDSVQEYWKNGTKLFSDATGHTVSTVGNVHIGTDDGTNRQDTTLAEVIIINGTVSAATRRRIEGYLAHKWGLQANLPASHPYRDAAPTVLWTPADMATTKVWYDAAAPSSVTASGGAVSQWSDKSGNGNHATQSDSARRPTHSTVNKTVTFDGTSDIMQVANDAFKNLQDFAVIALQKWNASVSWGNMAASWDSESGGNTEGWCIRERASFIGEFIFTRRSTGHTDDPTPATTDNQSDFIGVGYRSNPNLQFRHNGTITYSAANDTGSISYVGTNRSAIGGHYNADNWTTPLSFLNGYIKELIVIPNATVADVEKAEGYLAHKWGLQAKLPSNHPYKIDPPHI